MVKLQVEQLQPLMSQWQFSLQKRIQTGSLCQYFHQKLEVFLSSLTASESIWFHYLAHHLLECCAWWQLSWCDVVVDTEPYTDTSHIVGPSVLKDNPALTPLTERHVKVLASMETSSYIPMKAGRELMKIPPNWFCTFQQHGSSIDGEEVSTITIYIYQNVPTAWIRMCFNIFIFFNINMFNWQIKKLSH